MKRIFIAIKVTPEEFFLKMISALKTGLRDENIKWTDQDNIHLTLVFLGDTDDGMIKVQGIRRI
jgi:2'-5' RNA ligase